jgi:hypothetical protein
VAIEGVRGDFPAALLARPAGGAGNLFLAAGDRLVLLLFRKAGDFGRGGDGNFAGSDGRLKSFRPFLLDLFGGLDQPRRDVHVGGGLFTGFGCFPLWQICHNGNITPL